MAPTECNQSVGVTLLCLKGNQTKFLTQEMWGSQMCQHGAVLLMVVLQRVLESLADHWGIPVIKRVIA